jgi:hypothetical protein
MTAGPEGRPATGGCQGNLDPMSRVSVKQPCTATWSPTGWPDPGWAWQDGFISRAVAGPVWPCSC